MKSECTWLWWGVVFLGCCACLLGSFIFLTHSQEHSLDISFLDVGQGDAILVTSGRKQVLIDGGKKTSVLQDRLSGHVPWADTSLEIVMPTHPDADHIGALSNLANAMHIDTVIETRKENDTAISRSWEEAQERHAMKNVLAQRGTRVLFPNGAVLEVLYPYGPDLDSRADTNDVSVVSMLSYGEHSFLFTGDIGREYERYIDTKEVDVLKVAHHGSRSSSEQAFLDRIHPVDAIISSGRENTYGHPHEEVIQRLKNSGSRILRTDELGTITYRCSLLECSILFQR